MLRRRSVVSRWKWGPFGGFRALARNRWRRLGIIRGLAGGSRGGIAAGAVQTGGFTLSLALPPQGGGNRIAAFPETGVHPEPSCSRWKRAPNKPLSLEGRGVGERVNAEVRVKARRKAEPADRTESARQMHHHLAPARLVPVFPQVDPLPSTQSQPAVHNRNRKADRGQRCLASQALPAPLRHFPHPCGSCGPACRRRLPASADKASHSPAPNGLTSVPDPSVRSGRRFPESGRGRSVRPCDTPHIPVGRKLAAHAHPALAAFAHLCASQALPLGLQGQGSYHGALFRFADMR